ncbi:hypothetical protein KGF54_004734 [Candida jiufengensis]|uniref:uncharacterized protein n=1 Tax=Candida jiufengensis TaxID=497108 RepID=UPI0022252CCD|nr:uncharacterized protein KGF54_004734 [Candida jiufengensis]KAI5951659.1 hypothetical protein KGF54_004734 [Candida jiufengensis]
MSIFNLYEEDTINMDNTNNNNINNQQPNNQLITTMTLQQQQNLISQNSSSSINSIFDDNSNNNNNNNLLKTQSSTSTITPILSRNGSIRYNHKLSSNNLKLTKISTKDEEFLSNLNQKLNNLSQSQQQQQQQQPIIESSNEKLIILLVGLPASGKSTVCKQFKTYINSKTKYNSQIYNAGDIRRISNNFKQTNSNFFNPSNTEGIAKREEYAIMCLDNLIQDLITNKINIGFFDATNTTKERRNKLINKINNIPNFQPKIIIFDIKCLNLNLLEFNILNGKLNNLDYFLEVDKSRALYDFKTRINHYLKVYQPVTKEEIFEYDNKLDGYINFLNGGESFEIEKLCNEKLEESEWYFNLINEFKCNYMNEFGNEYIKNFENWKKNYNDVKNDNNNTETRQAIELKLE